MSDEQVLLTDDEREYFREMESMFNSRGWQNIEAEMEAEIEDLPRRTFESARSWDEVLAARAGRQKLMELASYPAQIDNRKENLMEERRQEAQEAELANRPDV